PGCLPSDRPTIQQYGAQDLLDYFRAFEAPNLPAPYNYSDISTGLIGLILGSPRDATMGDAAVDGWFDLVRERVTDPLGMADTFLYSQDATPSQQRRLAGGYAQALATATVSPSGALTGISLQSHGSNYGSEPAVHIVGGGGSGAAASAVLSGQQIAKIDLERAGHGYVAPPVITFSAGGATAPAKANA